MLTCPLCLKLVSLFKSNSHVIPRWALKNIKTNGQNILITPDGATNNQKDFIGDFVCADCENGFAVDDGVAAAVVRDQKSLERSFLDVDQGVEFHDVKFASAFIKFSTGILLRTHLYKNFVKEGDLLGPYFEKVRKMYVGEMAYCKILICRDTELKICTLPQKQKFGSCTTQEYAILGYRIVHFLKERDTLGDHFNQVFVNANQFNIMIDNRKDSHWHRGLAAHVQGKRFPTS